MQSNTTAPRDHTAGLTDSERLVIWHRLNIMVVPSKQLKPMFVIMDMTQLMAVRPCIKCTQMPTAIS